MKRRRAVAAVGLVLVGLLATSCSKDGGTAGGGLAEVAPAFEQETARAGADFLFFSYRGTKLEVSKDGKTDEACESGQAKRVYDASFPMLDGRADSDKIFDMKVNSYDQQYTITKATDQQTNAPMAELKRKDKPFKLDIKIDRSVKEKPRVLVHGETECLDAA